MSSRLLKLRDYLSKYRLKTREKRQSFMNYIRVERQNIIQRERQKMFKRLVFWTAFLGSSYIVYNEIYRKKMEMGKMNRKLDHIYPSIMER